MSGILFFNSRKNYLKRHPVSGSTSIPAPATFATWANYVSTFTVNHNLGYVPQVRVYYEPYSDGKVYPAIGDRLTGTGPGINYNDIICLWEVDSTNLTIYLESASSETGTVPIYWVVYLDS